MANESKQTNSKPQKKQAEGKGKKAGGAGRGKYKAVCAQGDYTGVERDSYTAAQKDANAHMLAKSTHNCSVVPA